MSIPNHRDVFLYAMNLDIIGFLTLMNERLILYTYIRVLGRLGRILLHV